MHLSFVSIDCVFILGMQAVQSADFALAQFRSLSRFILVHGRWNYRRVSIVILFSFYKNMALVMTLFLYSFFNQFSGQTLYESYLMVGWNVLYTFFPILVLGTHTWQGYQTIHITIYISIYLYMVVVVVGILDQDISAETILKYPRLYCRNNQGHSHALNMTKITIWVVNALLHSLLVYLLTTYLM